jgi:hypothetical protein
MVKYLGLRVKYAYIRLKRNLALYFTLWFLALLAAVSLIITSIFLPNDSPVKIWSSILVIILFIKLSYDVYLSMRTRYDNFKEKYDQTDRSLRDL